MMPNPDQQEIVTYLNAIFGRCEDGQGEIILGDKDKYQHGIFPPSRLANLAQLIPFTPSCYIKHALINSEAMLARNKHGVGTEEEVSAINAIALDVDANKEGYAARSEVLEALYKMPKPPSMVVNSNGLDGGFHVYWILDKPYRVEGDRDFLKHISEVWHDELNSYVRVDPTYDLSRYLRPVGCKRKSGNFVSIHEYHPDRRYTIEDLTIPGCKREPDIQGQGRLMVHNWLSRCNAKVYEQSRQRDRLLWFIECPKHYLHTTPNNKRDCRIVQDNDGKLGGSCFHSSCGLNSWAQLRDAIGKTIKQDYRQAEEPSEKIKYKIYNAKELDQLDPRLEYLVEGVIVRNQHGMFVAPQKTMKTTTCIDLALSLASGKQFLGKFNCQQSKVLMMTGESGLSVVQETSRRIAKSKDFSLSDVADQFIVSDQIPLLYSSEHQQAIAQLLDDVKPALLIADPVYMMIDGADAGNLFTMGAQLKPTAMLCEERGVTILLVHHATKSSNNVKEYTPLGLQDIAWSGFGEFARQWVFLNRREEYELGTGDHRLWLSYGGSAGHSGCWGVDVFEGPNDAIQGREYAVTVSDSQAAIESKNEEAELAREAKQKEKEHRAIKRRASEILKAFVGQREAITKNQIKTLTGLKDAALDVPLAYLIRTGIVDEAPAMRNNREHEGFVRTEKPYED